MTGQIDDQGRCPLHPAMQLRSLKKNGEWRVLMSVCPLCISGLPPSGMSIANREPPPVRSEPEAGTRGARERRRGSREPSTEPPSRNRDRVGLDASRRTPDSFGEEDDASIPPTEFQQSLNLDDLESDQVAMENGPRKGETRKPRSSGRRGEKDKKRSNAPKKERPTPPQQQVQQQVHSFDETENAAPDNYREFHNFLLADYADQKMHANSNSSSGEVDPKFINKGRMARPPPEAVAQHYPPPTPQQQMHPPTARPPPPSRPQQSQQPTKEPPKRPDPESIDPPPRPQHNVRYPPNRQAAPITPPRQLQQPRTYPKPDSDERSVASMNSITRRHQQQQHQPMGRVSPYKPQEPDSDERSVASMNSITRRHHQQQHQPMGRVSPYKLQEDEMSAVSANSNARHLYNLNPSDSTESDREEDDEEESESAVSKEIPTSEYDAKGKCVRHPTVRLRKKKLFGGWNVVLSNCPECCLDEMRRVKDRRSSSGKGRSKSAGSRGERSKSSRGSKKKKKYKNPPMSQVDIGEDAADDKSIGTASTITISSYTLASGGRHAKNWQEFASSPDEEEDVGGGGPARVTRMPHADQRGERGWYTGAVDGTTGAPHGYGTMNFSDGAVFEGLWRNGASVAPSAAGEGPATSRSVPAKAARHPGNGRPALETHYEDDRRRRSASRSRPGTRTMLPPPPAMPPPPQRKVVCGMPWTDPDGNVASYTGEVNGLNIPDGMGSVRYGDGVVVEGLWNDGEIDGAEDDGGSAVGFRPQYREGGGLDGFLGRDNGRVRGIGGSASVM